MRVGALAVEEGAAQLLLERLDGARQRRLRDMAALGGAREIELCAQRKEIANLMHFHGAGPAASWPTGSAGGGHGRITSRRRDCAPGSPVRDQTLRHCRPGNTAPVWPLSVTGRGTP